LPSQVDLSANNVASEYLVTLTGKQLSMNDTRIIQFDDPGKASLIINIGINEKNVSIANIHCPFGNSRNLAFDKLVKELGSNQFIIIGDLNSEQWELEKMFDKRVYKFSNITKPTRVAKFIKKTRKGDEVVVKESTLDHMIGTNGIAYSQIFVEPNDNLSDHLLIGATIRVI
jgi:endonuclease/exonuclease/phosphatase family metal-dependent hydrolase